MNGNMTIGESLKNLRKHKKISQMELAKRTGLSQQHISKIENNKVSIKLDTFLLILNAFDLTINYTDK